MLKILKENSLKGLILNLIIMVTVTVVFLVTFFYAYLPFVTNHGETITVPNLEEQNMEEVVKIIEEKGLRYEVTDSNYISRYEPNTVISQNPLKGSKVKLNRKIYLVVNATNPPLVKVPDIIEGSVKNAQLLLDSYGLQLGRINYVQDLATNAVKAIYFKGRKIEKEELENGVEVPKGSHIDIDAGDGLGRTYMDVPNVIGQRLERAKTILIGMGLIDGKIEYVKADEELGIVVEQSPQQGARLKIGNEVKLWVSGYFPEDQTDSTKTAQPDSLKVSNSK